MIDDDDAPVWTSHQLFFVLTLSLTPCDHHHHHQFNLPQFNNYIPFNNTVTLAIKMLQQPVLLDSGRASHTIVAFAPLSLPSFIVFVQKKLSPTSALNVCTNTHLEGDTLNSNVANEGVV